MQLSSSLTVELLDKPFLLEKRIDLLRAIQQEGSISKAAKAVPMSYKAAWDAVDAMNNLAPMPIVARETGGKGGGGSHLTEYGEKLLDTYRMLKQEQARFLERLGTIADMDSERVKTLGRMSMQISARNQLTGTIEQIDTGSVSAQVYLRLKNGDTLVLVITKGAVENLGLQAGDEATAIFKSSSVLLATGAEPALSARNILPGVVEHITTGTVNSEVVVALGEGHTIVATVTTSAVKALGLAASMPVYVAIKSSDVMMGK